MGECLILRSGSGSMDTSDATATSSQILSGYTAYVNDQKITGTIENRGSVSQTLNCGGSYTIEEGYYSGGSVSVNSLASQTDANAGAGQILNSYTAWVKGSKITGTMTNIGAVSQALSANGSYTIPAGWHNGSGKVTQSLSTWGATTVTPGTSNKLACASGRWTTGSIWCVGASTLVASNIKNGVTIFGVKGNIRTHATYTVNGLWASSTRRSFKNGDGGTNSLPYIEIPCTFTPTCVSVLNYSQNYSQTQYGMIRTSVLTCFFPYSSCLADGKLYIPIGGSTNSAYYGQVSGYY